MKKILLQVQGLGFANNHIFEKSGTPNNTLDGWYRLKNKLATLGYDLMTADDNDLKDCHCIIFYDAHSLDSSFKSFSSKVQAFAKPLLTLKSAKTYPTRNLYKEAVEAGLHDKLVFLMWECKTVCPLNFSEKVWSKFNHIITWDDNLIKKDSKFIKYYMPMESHQALPEIIPFNQKKLLVNISYNKYSGNKDELYSARRKTISYFNTYYPNDFDLYGVRWNIPATKLQEIFPFLVKKYSTYRGRTNDKLQTLSKYKFNICYENNSNTQGRVTEKIFNAIKAKTVPIYWGSTNIHEYIDEAVFIDRRKFQTEEDLALFLKNMTEIEYKKYIQAGELYMQSEKYAKFLPDSFCDRMAEILTKI